MNITCISDIHLNRFTSYEFYKGFRDEQYLRAADRVIEISKSTNSKILCILGDLIDTPILTPKATHLLIEFAEKLSGYYDIIYYIVGQHDMDCKLRDWSQTDTIVTLLSKISDKFKYVDKQIIDIENRRIYFRDFMFETEVIDDVPECDVYLGHVTLSELFGQTIDPQPYKLGIFGDIHSIVDMGKNHSVGGFLQKGLSDAPYGQVVTLNLDDLTFIRTPLIDKNNKFLRIYKEGTEDNPDEYTIIRKTTNHINSIELKSVDNSEIKEVKLSDLDNIIVDKLRDLDLLDLHKNVVSECEVYDKIDFNFNLKELKIHNFRSIADYEINFDKYPGLLFISGDNGSGKTSLLSALYVALVGDRRIRVYNRKRYTDLRLEVSLEYHGFLYTIVRMPGKTEFYIDGEVVSKGNKTELENYIYQVLPFLSYLYIFRLGIKPNYFELLFNSRLIYTLFGLDNFAQYFRVSSSKIKQLNNEKNRLINEISSLNGELDVRKSRKLQLISELESLVSEFNKYEESKINSINDLIELKNSLKELKLKRASISSDLDVDMDRYNSIKNCKVELANAKNANSVISKYKLELDKSKSRLVKLQKELSELESDTSSTLLCPKCGFLINTDVNNLLEKRKSNIKSEISDIELELPKLELESSKELIDLTELNKIVIEFSTYESKLDDINKIKILDQSIEEKTIRFSKYIEDEFFKNTNDNLRSIRDNYKILANSIKSKNKELDDVELDINNSSKKLDELNNLISELDSNLIKYSQYNSLFDENNSTSIHKEVLLKVSESLSDDEISFVSHDDEDSLGLQLKVDREWMDYNTCSDGQRTYMDLKILSKLLSLMDGNGILFLDEVLGSIRAENIEKCLSVIRTLTATHILMISHNMTVMSDFDSKLECKLIDGCSNFS